MQKLDVSSVEEKFEALLGELSPEEGKLVSRSHDAYLHMEKWVMPEEEREAAAMNGDVVSESEVENPDSYLKANSDTPERATLLRQKIAYIRRKARRDRAKVIAEQKFLARKRSKKVCGIVDKFPGIGKEIEHFVEERSVGADRWRRTGVLTFDGNKSVSEKVTYGRIKEHLESVYGRKFGYGTVVQLCVTRNWRRLSAKRYKGVAKVTTRRARKGFCLRYNPDTHWSAALYKGLNLIQHTDGTDILNVNRDDAAGFRLDTLTTHRLHRSPMVKGSEVLTTRTDYVNRYPSVLQTTCYNFTATETSTEQCAGIVKGAGIYPKNPAQHYSDFKMLEVADALQPAFINSATGTPKLIQCVRVDGANDEGPSHLEVQFWWSLHHMQRATFATLVTARSSGASYLNRVELQNGCLALAHANLFIPSNLNGSCFSPIDGKLDQERLKKNMDTATDIYISRCNGAPCGDSVIHLFRGSDSSASQKLRSYVLTFLKGSEEQKAEIRQKNPEEYRLIDSVWQLRQRHMVRDLPAQYFFYLRCCQEKDCCHPLCTGQGPSPPCWFTGGPPLSYLPIPIQDPSQPWGNPNCSKCKGECSGHFLDPKESINSKLPQMSKPPSQLLKEAFDQLNGETAEEEYVHKTAKECLLPPSEVLIWFEHLRRYRETAREELRKLLPPVA